MRMRREKREKDDTRRSERFRKKRTRETFEKVSHFQTFTFQACGLRPVNSQIIRKQPGRQPRCVNEAESMNIDRKNARRESSLVDNHGARVRHSSPNIK